MSFALAKKDVHCPNCHYEGASEIQGTGMGLGFAAVLLIIVGFYAVWPLALLGLVMLLVAMFRPAKHVCPSCKWENPVPLKEWQARNPATD